MVAQKRRFVCISYVHVLMHQWPITEQFIQGNIPLKHLLNKIKTNSEGFLYPIAIVIAIPLTCLKWDWMNGSLAILLTFFDFEPILFSKSLFSVFSLSLKQYYLAAIGSSRFLSKLSLMQKLWFTYPLHSYILHKVHEIYISGEEEKLILFQKVHLKNLDTYLGKYYLIFMWSHLCQIDIKTYQTYLFIYHLSLNFQNWNHQSWIYMVRFTSYITELNSCIWKILFRKKEIRKVQIPRIV